MIWWGIFPAEGDDLSKIREMATAHDESKETKYTIACVGKCSSIQSCHCALMEPLGTLWRTKQSPQPPRTHILVEKTIDKQTV